MFKEARKQIFYWLLIGCITVIVGFLYKRYFVTPLDSYYTVLEIKPPSDSVIGNCLESKVGPDDMQVIRLFLRNNSDKPIKLSSIEIYGVKSYCGFSVSFLDKKVNTEGISAVERKLFGSEGRLVLSNLPALKKELGVYVWGAFFPTYIEVTFDAGTARAEEAYIVKGVEVFFAMYWKLILFITALVITFIIYYHRSKRYEKP